MSEAENNSLSEDFLSNDQSNNGTVNVKKRPVYIFDSLTPKVFWGYAVGHVFNDLCASSWFNFVLFYLTKVLQFNAGSYTMLFGQIADALGTPSAGILSDKYNTRFGKRTPWYVLSYIMVMITFIPMWSYPIMKSILPLENDSFKTFFFIFFPAAFNYFWAFGYIAHISLVPSMTCSRVRRDILNTRRNTFSFFANMLLLLLALFFFQIIDSSEQQFQAIGLSIAAIGTIFFLIFIFTVNEVPLTKACNAAVTRLKIVLKQREEEKNKKKLVNAINQASDLHSGSNYQNSSSIHSGLKPQQQQNQVQFQDQQESESEQLMGKPSAKHAADFDESQEVDPEAKLVNSNPQTLRLSVPRKQSRGESIADHVVNWKQWFKEKQFYQYALVFMFSRLFCNVTTTMMNFYLYYVIEINGHFNSGEPVQLTFQLALIPLLLYIASVGASSILNILYQKIGRKMTFSLGILLMVISLTPLLFLQADQSTMKNLIYPLSLLIGASQALILNTSINLISEVIGLRGAGGAFVFGAYSFLDKLVTGIVLFAITESSGYQENDVTFIRWTIVLVPMISGFGAWILILFGKAKDYDNKNAAKMSTLSLGDEFVN